MTIGFVALALGCVALASVPAVVWAILHDRQGVRQAVVACTVGYLVVGNVLSRFVLMGVVYPENDAASGLAVIDLARLWMLHGAVSMGSSAALTIGVAAGLRRVLPAATG
jgi:hypothetical protein